MTAAREVDHGWWRETDGRQARLTWSEDLGGTLYLFHVSGESEPLLAGIEEDDVAVLVLGLELVRCRTVEGLRAAVEAVR